MSDLDDLSPFIMQWQLKDFNEPNTRTFNLGSQGSGSVAQTIQQPHYQDQYCERNTDGTEIVFLAMLLASLSIACIVIWVYWSSKFTALQSEKNNKRGKVRIL